MTNGTRKRRPPAKRKKSSKQNGGDGIHRFISHSFEIDAWKYALPAIKNVAIAVILSGLAYQALSHLSDPITLPIVAGVDKSPPVTVQEVIVRNGIERQRDVSDRKNSPERTDGNHVGAGSTAFVSSNNVIIRENPKPNSKVLGKAIFGTSVEVLAFNGNWVQIRSSAQNLSGWTEKMRLNF